MPARFTASLVVFGILTAGVAAVPAGGTPGEDPARGSVGRSSPVAPLPLVLLRRSVKKAPGGSGLDVLAAANPNADAIARRVARVASDPAGFVQFALRLDASAKRYLARDPKTAAAARRILSEPAYLFLSDHEGGFPAEGFWLEQRDGSLRELRDVPFVDLVVRERDLVPGDSDGFEAIYAHELGHLVMTALVGPMPKRASSGAHFITVRTDGWYAFNEGWGEHFQPMALDYAGRGTPAPAEDRTARERWWYERFSREQIEGCWICPANLRFLRWQGPREQRLRDGALRAGLFAREPALPARLTGDARPAKEVRMYRDLAAPGPVDRLKNGPQMLASEGVVAALFYRLATDERLRNAYEDAAFYERFLPAEQSAALAALGPRALVPPAENVYFKLFAALHERFTWGSWPALELVSAYAARFPAEAAPVYEVFLDVTRGVTVERDAARRENEPGYLAGVRDRLLAGSARLDGNLGPPLWIAATGMTLGMGLFRYFPVPSSFTFDLNAADVSDLRSMPGVTASLAAAIVGEREKRSAFESVADLKAVPGMTPELLSSFRAQADRMEKRLGESKAPRTDPGWMKAILAPMLRGSYYLAAAWQFGTAMVLAGLLFLAVRRLLGRALGVPRPQASRPTRRRWRRAVLLLVRAIAAAAAPLAVSVAIYAAGYFPTPLNMAAVGAVLGACACGVSVARGSLAGDWLVRAVPTLAAWVTTATIVGWMY